MKRNFLLSALLLALFITQILGIVYLNNPDIFASEDDEVEAVAQITTVRYHLATGEITHTYTAAGTVIANMPEVYLDTMIIENITDKSFCMIKSKGDILAPGDEIYQYNGKKQTIDCNAQLIDVRYDTTDDKKCATITLLNYDKLFIQVDVKVDKIEQITYDTSVQVLLNGQKYTAEITDIGYEVQESCVPVCLSVPINCRPGTVVDVTFVLGVQTAGLYVPVQAVYHNDSGYFAYVETQEGTEYRQLTVGEFFMAEENGITTEYVELLSGVSEDDVLIVETIEGTGKAIMENMRYE